MTGASNAESDSGRRGESRAVLLWMLAVFVAPLLVYGQTLSFGFVNFDDDIFIADNPHVRGGLSLDSVRWAFTTAPYQNYQPLVWLSHMADVAMFGPAPGMQHGVNVALHALNGVLLFLLLRAWTGELGKSAAVALLFAVHPLHVESVAWISQRKELIGTFLSFIALGVYTQYARMPSRRGYIILALLSLAAMLAKPALFVLPLLLMVIDYWPLVRCGNSNDSSTALRKRLIEKGPLAVIAAAIAVIAVLMLDRAGAPVIHSAYSWPTRLANALVAIAVYPGQTVWPARLVPFYPHPGTIPPWPQIGVSAALIAFVTAAALRYRSSHPFLFMGWGWYLATVVPQSGLVYAGLHGHADRHAYLPMTGLLIVAVWGAAAIAGRRRLGARSLLGVGAAAVALFGLMAYVQAGHWRTSGALWQYTAAVMPENAMAHQRLGELYLAAGRLDEAQAALERAVELTKDQPLARVAIGGRALNSLGTIASARGRYDKASALFASAADRLPGDLDVHSNWGEALLAAQRPPDAIKVLRAVTEMDPDRAPSWNTLAVALLVDGQIEGSLEAAKRAAELEPGVAEYHYRIALAEFADNRYDDALSSLHDALALNPDFVEALQLRMEIYSRRGIAPEDVPPLGAP